MKKLLIATLTLLCACALTLQAQDAAKGKAKGKMTDEQKTLMKEMTTKYDTNKDGKLDKDERAAMSQEDKDKLTAAGLGGKKKKTAE